MKLLIDTSTKDLIIILLDNSNNVVGFKHQRNLIKKADNLPDAVESVLDKNNINDVTDIYITIGPGSFVGSRVGLVYARTISQITGANIWTATSGHFYVGNTNGKFYVDARSNLSYEFIVEEGKLKSLELVPHQEDSEIDFNDIKNNIANHLSVFEKQDDIFSIKPTYIKKPKIGGN